MNHSLTKLALSFAALFAVAVTVRVAGWPLVEAKVSAPEVAGAPAARRVPIQRRDAADSLGTLIVARDPFRVARRPAAVAYDPFRAGQPESPQPPKPVLALVGLVAGAEPSAVVEGFPGVEGARVVRVGDVVAGLTVQRIAGGEVRIAGMDTVWVLRVREPWR